MAKKKSDEQEAATPVPLDAMADETLTPVAVEAMADGVLAPVAGADRPLDEARAAIVCDRDGREVARVALREGLAWPFRITHDARLYEHTGEDADGRWIYLESR